MDVLLVEDDPVQAEAIEAALEEAESWKVRRAKGVESAREALEEGGLDVAVVDHELPDGNGLDVLQACQRAAPEMPVVFLTGTGDEEVALKALSLGAARYIAKGEDAIDELIDTIGEVSVSFSGVTPVELVDEETQGTDRTKTEKRSPRPGPGQVETRVDPDEEQLDGLLEDLVEDPVRGIGVFDDSGEVLAARLPEGVDGDAAGLLTAAVAHQFEGLAGIFDLGIEGQYLLARGENGVLALTVVPGPLLITLLLDPETPREKATGTLFEIAAKVWEKRD